MTEPARNFQHYEVLRRADGTPWELGRGAMGITYKAFDVNLCCEVALKVVSGALVEHPEARDRFVREARAAAALRHRNVASVYHLGNDGEHFFYAMEFINGETLDALVRRVGPVSVENTLRVMLQVARALAAAARQNLVHRDIKPTNLMVTHEDADEETVVKVIDFGLARPVANTTDAPPLTIGGFVGTPQYASPEQLEERPLDARSDFYSLGVTAWFLLTGRVPFTGSLATVCQAQLTQPPPWEQLPATVPTCVRGLLGHLLAKDAARRPQNAADLRVAIETCQGKVEGTERKRDLKLATMAQAAMAPREEKPDAAARTPQTGTMLNHRYRLLREIGGRNGMQVYQGRDESAADAAVAIKILPAALTANTAERDRITQEVRLAQAAAHPHLVQIRALEQCAAPPTVFLVEEWLAGFTLRDLLAGRGGALPVAETLLLLGQAASAVDHAARCRLGALDLTLTDLHVSFSSLEELPDDGAQARRWLPRSCQEWPDWALKIHPFRVQSDPLALDTWAGGATLLPSAGAETRRSAAGKESLAGGSVQALARVVYELLGGSPAVHPPDGGPLPARYASLPALNEEGNRILRQVLAGESAMVHGGELHEALAEAVAGQPVRGNFPAMSAEPARLLPSLARELPVPVEGQRDEDLIHETAATSRGLARRSDQNTVYPGPPTVATQFQDGNPPDVGDPEEEAAGSAWDRLNLATEKRAHPGHWVAGLVGLVAVFVLGFGGVLVWLWQQPPAHAASAFPTKKRLPEPTNPRSVARQATPAPLAVSSPAAKAVLRPVSSPPPAVRTESSFPLLPGASAATVESTPVPPPVVATTESPAPTPPRIETPVPSAAMPESARLSTVRLESVPSGAQIRLGEKILGTTPLWVQLPLGDHELVARYPNWPVTHHSIHLDGSDVRTTVEIRLMRPELIPGVGSQVPATPESHARRTPVPAARLAVPRMEPSTPEAQPSFAPRPPPATPAPSEPEVRAAQRVLTPFLTDEPADASPPPKALPVNPQPFSVDPPDNN